MSACCKETINKGVGIGMAIAAGMIAEWDDVRAAEILHAAGLTSFEALRQAGVDEYDIKQLRSVVSEIGRKERRFRTGGFAAVDRLAA